MTRSLVVAFQCDLYGVAKHSRTFIAVYTQCKSGYRRRCMYLFIHTSTHIRLPIWTHVRSIKRKCPYNPSHSLGCVLTLFRTIFGLWGCLCFTFHSHSNQVATIEQQIWNRRRSSEKRQQTRRPTANFSTLGEKLCVLDTHRMFLIFVWISVCSISWNESNM